MVLVDNCRNPVRHTRHGMVFWLLLSLSLWGLFCLPAKAAPHVVINADTMEVYASETPHQRWAPASLTKIMTTYLALRAVKSGRLTMKSPVFISISALDNPPTKMNFPYGTILRLDKALAVIMVKSANDVAQAIGEAVEGNNAKFVQSMNEMARELGMEDTNFVNANGLPDPNQYSSAHDLALLSAAIFRDFPDYAYLFRIGAIQVKNKVKSNHNRLLVNFAGADGLKTGFVCASGLNLAASAKRQGRHMIAVVLGEPSGKTRNAIAAMYLARAFQKAEAGNSGDKLPKLSELPKMIWWNSKPADISQAVCVKGGRNHWKKGLGDYVKLLEERYYSPNTPGKTVAITFGGATGPNPFFFPNDNGDTAKDLIGIPSPRPPIECFPQYEKALGITLIKNPPKSDASADGGKEQAGGKGSETSRPSYSWKGMPLEDGASTGSNDKIVEVKKGARVIASSKAEKPDGAGASQASSAENGKGTANKCNMPKSADSASGGKTMQGKEVLIASSLLAEQPLKEVPVPQGSPESKGKMALPLIDEDEGKPRTACIPYPIWRNGDDPKLKPVYDPGALDQLIDEKIKNKELVDL